MKYLHSHTWKAVLNRIHRQFFSGCDPACVTFNGFENTDAIFDEDGERIWAIYSIAPQCSPTWWRAQFLDTCIRVTSNTAGVYDIPYQDIQRVMLPASKSAVPEMAVCGDHRFYYQCTQVIGISKREYEVRGIVGANGMRDVYLWHHLSVAELDRNRHQASHQTS